MSLRPGMRAACRALAIRSRPVAPRSGALSWTVSKRTFADDSSQTPPISQKPLHHNAAGASDAAASKSSQEAAGHSIDKQTKLPEDFSVETSTADAVNEIESTLSGLTADDVRPQSKAEEYDALAEEAAADKSSITLEEALQQLEQAAQSSTAGLEGGLTASQEEHLYREGNIPPAMSDGNAQRDLEILASGGILSDAYAEGEMEKMMDAKGRSHKFRLPELPSGNQAKLKSRYHPVLDQMTNLLMRHGKKSVAQRNMAMILNFLRTSPPPILSQKYSLLAGHPPPHHLPLNPVLYLTIAIDSVAPIIRIKSFKGAASGGRNLEMPHPLAVRQRRRTAFQWILDIVNKKRSMGSGRTQLAHRIASEIIAVTEGRSPVWEKRMNTHRQGTAVRANLGTRPIKRN